MSRAGQRVAGAGRARREHPGGAGRASRPHGGDLGTAARRAKPWAEAGAPQGERGGRPRHDAHPGSTRGQAPLSDPVALLSNSLRARHDDGGKMVATHACCPLKANSHMSIATVRAGGARQRCAATQNRRARNPVSCERADLRRCRHECSGTSGRWSRCASGVSPWKAARGRSRHAARRTRARTPNRSDARSPRLPPRAANPALWRGAARVTDLTPRQPRGPPCVGLGPGEETVGNGPARGSATGALASACATGWAPPPVAIPQPCGEPGIQGSGLSGQRALARRRWGRGIRRYTGALEVRPAGSSPARQVVAVAVPPR